MVSNSCGPRRSAHAGWEPRGGQPVSLGKPGPWNTAQGTPESSWRCRDSSPGSPVRRIHPGRAPPLCPKPALASSLPTWRASRAALPPPPSLPGAAPAPAAPRARRHLAPHRGPPPRARPPATAARGCWSLLRTSPWCPADRALALLARRAADPRQTSREEALGTARWEATPRPRGSCCVWRAPRPHLPSPGPYPPMLASQLAAAWSQGFSGSAPFPNRPFRLVPESSRTPGPELNTRLRTPATAPSQFW